MMETTHDFNPRAFISPSSNETSIPAETHSLHRSLKPQRPSTNPIVSVPQADVRIRASDRKVTSRRRHSLGEGSRGMPMQGMEHLELAVFGGVFCDIDGFLARGEEELGRWSIGWVMRE